MKKIILIFDILISQTLNSIIVHLWRWDQTPWIHIRPLKINCAFWVTSLVPFAFSGRKTRALYFMFNFSHTSIRLVVGNCPHQEQTCLFESYSCVMHYPEHKVIIYLRCHTGWYHPWCPSHTGAHFNIISEKATRFFPLRACFCLARS